METGGKLQSWLLLTANICTLVTCIKILWKLHVLKNHFQSVNSFILQVSHLNSSSQGNIINMDTVGACRLQKRKYMFVKHLADWSTALPLFTMICFIQVFCLYQSMLLLRWEKKISFCFSASCRDAFPAHSNCPWLYFPVRTVITAWILHLLSKQPQCLWHGFHRCRRHSSEILVHVDVIASPHVCRLSAAHLCCQSLIVTHWIPI